MGITNEFERDLNDTSFLGRPGRIDMAVFQNTLDAGDGYPGLQKAFRNYLHEGGMENDPDVNTHDIINIGELVFPSATIHSSGTQIHIHPNTGNADGNLILHPIGSNTSSSFYLRNSVTSNYGDFIIKVSGTTASLESALGGGGTAPDTLNMNDADWDNINIGDDSASISMNAVGISAAQFGYVGNMNQDVITTSNVDFGQITMGGNIIMGSDDITFTAGGLVDGVDVSAHVHSGAGTNGVKVPFTSLSGDIVYTQLDSIVDTSGTGGTTLISRADHVHTASDGSSKVDHINLNSIGSNAHSVIDTHLGSSSNPHSVGLGQAFLIDKTITTATSGNAFVVGGGGANADLSIWGTSSVLNLVSDEALLIGFDTGTAGKAIEMWNDGSNNVLGPNGDMDLGNDANYFRDVYYCAFVEKSCADFRDTSSDNIYNILNKFEAMTDGTLHYSKASGQYFPHVDFSKLPDELAAIATVDHTIEMYKDVEGEKVEYDVAFKKGDKAGIDFGSLVYMMKSLVLKSYEKIVVLENEIELLKGG